MANLFQKYNYYYLVCQGKQEWKPSPRSYKRAIRFASIIIFNNHFPWPKKEKEKKKEQFLKKEMKK